MNNELQNVPHGTAPAERDIETLYDLLEPKKKRFAEMMIQSFGNVQQSCNACGIKSRKTYYNWLKEDPLFHEFIKGCEFDEMLLDFAESKLVNNINNGDVASVIFFLKTKGQKRGYIEKQTLSAKISMDKRPSWFDDDKDVPKDFAEYEMVIDTPKQTE